MKAAKWVFDKDEIGSHRADGAPGRYFLAPITRSGWKPWRTIWPLAGG